MFRQSCIEEATIAWSQHPHTNSQHNEIMATFHFNISNHLQIAQTKCVHVDNHVGLMSIVFFFYCI